MQKAELTNQNSNILTAFREAKHDDEVITVLLIKILDNYNEKVDKRNFYQNVHSRLINRKRGQFSLDVNFLSGHELFPSHNSSYWARSPQNRQIVYQLDFMNVH